MDSAVKKVNVIARIVRLRQVVQRWKANSLTRRRLRPALHPSSSSDLDEPAGSSRRIPSGSLAVYVGPDRVRFVIPTRFLYLPVFSALLREAEDEFGFRGTGGLALPCEPGFFREVLRFLEGDERRFGGMGLDEFLHVITESVNDTSSCKESWSRAFSPLLHKNRVLWSNI